jgi:hypothetical protein
VREKMEPNTRVPRKDNCESVSKMIVVKLQEEKAPFPMKVIFLGTKRTPGVGSFSPLTKTKLRTEQEEKRLFEIESKGKFSTRVSFELEENAYDPG